MCNSKTDVEGRSSLYTHGRTKKKHRDGRFPGTFLEGQLFKNDGGKKKNRREKGKRANLLVLHGGKERRVPKREKKGDFASENDSSSQSGRSLNE